MVNEQKLIAKILSGRSDANIAFNDLRALLLKLGFEERTRGSHHVFRKSGVSDLVNIQRPGITLAITGDWDALARQARAMV